MPYDDLTDDQLLSEGLSELNLLGVESLQPLLVKYIEEIELFNPAYGLVKVGNRRELIVKHILDSLAPLNIITKLLSDRDKPWRIADVGSGAGLPGIPLSFCLNNAEFTLVERMGRRAGFLRDCVAVLGAKNIQIEETDMEKADPGRFDLVVFRAFRPLEHDILKGLQRLLKPQGFLAAWKGRYENTREEMLAAEKSSPGLKWEVMPVKVPFLEEERHIVVIYRV